MKAAPAVKTHARVSCIQREKPVSEVIVLQFTREFGTGTLYLVYLYPRWFTRSLIFYLFIRTFEVHGFLQRERKRRRTNVCLLPSFTPASSCDQTGFTLEPPAEFSDRTLAYTLYAFTNDNGVFMSLCETQTYTIRSTPGKHSDADRDYTWLNSGIWELLCLIS